METGYGNEIPLQKPRFFLYSCLLPDEFVFQSQERGAAMQVDSITQLDQPKEHQSTKQAEYFAPVTPSKSSNHLWTPASMSEECQMNWSLYNRERCQLYYKKQWER